MESPRNILSKLFGTTRRKTTTASPKLEPKKMKSNSESQGYGGAPQHLVSHEEFENSNPLHPHHHQPSPLRVLHLQTNGYIPTISTTTKRQIFLCKESSATPAERVFRYQFNPKQQGQWKETSASDIIFFFEKKKRCNRSETLSCYFGGQATTQSKNMNDYDVSCASPMILDFDFSFSEFASPEKIRQCEQMEMYPPGVVNEALELDQEPEQVKVIATQQTPALQLIVEKQEDTHPSPPTSPPSSHHQTSKVRYTYWPRRVEHPLHTAAVHDSSRLPMIVTSGPLILEQNYSTSPPLSNTQKRRSSQQIKAMSPEQRKEEVRQRDRCHSATYNLRKKEKLVELEETLKIKKTQLNALNAKNIALSSKLTIGSDMLQLLKNQIKQKLLKKHQYQLREKEEAVKKLEAALEDIEVQEAHPEVKKSTLASRKSRTHQRYRTAMLELEVFKVEVDLRKETLAAVELNKIQRKREVDSARREQENVGKLNGTGVILPGLLSHSKELQPPLTAKKEPRTSSQGFWTYSSKGRHCGTVSESPYYPTKLF
ncbi:hypothetical protein CAEBREN_21322 [Caenorhabditis brenneri]|uniref:Uncharacterized protein n=1 Tax=Caenorhabditis brenneri TaxID=135651 RepID=G0N626_CAEBE|nr:hypothetical protein CAEBREN_21322 [Caenorhabditis brenneri]